jgi:mono/diheme cytochrome c family protein
VLAVLLVPGDVTARQEPPEPAGDAEATAATLRGDNRGAASIRADGERAYRDNCSACHGADGGGRIGPSLEDNRNLARADYVLAIILRGGDGMPAFHGRLGEAEVVAVAGHIRSAWGNRFGAVEPDGLALRWWRGAREPAELYARVCARCHGLDGGGEMGPAFVGNENLRDAQYVVGKILHGQGGMPAFEGLLDPERVEALASFVRNSFGNDFGPVEPHLTRSLQTPPPRLPGQLTVSLIPPGARLSVVGPGSYRRFASAASGETLGDLAPGLYQVSATKAGYRSRSVAVEVRPGEANRLALHLEPIDAPESAPTAPPLSVDSPSPASFAVDDASQLYVRSCSACHGPNGRGGLGPALAGNGNLQSAEFVLQRILHGTARMPGFAHRLSDRHIAAIASHERTSWGNEAGEVRVEQVVEQREEEGPQEASLHSRSSGRRIYETACAVCHGAVGNGGVGPAFRGNPDLADLPFTVSRIVMGGGGMPAFNRVLSSTELAEVATFIRNSWGNDFGLVAIGQAENYHGGASSLRE